jgi:hypothetical protein
MSAESRNIGGHRPPLQQESKSIQLLVLATTFLLLPIILLSVLPKKKVERPASSGESFIASYQENYSDQSPPQQYSMAESPRNPAIRR